MNYLNPNWLLSRLLERLGIVTYLERTEFAAHFFAGSTFTLMGVLWGWYISVTLVLWTLIDEFVFDGWKGGDTLIDLFSKLICPFIYFGWLVWTLVR